MKIILSFVITLNIFVSIFYYLNNNKYLISYFHILNLLFKHLHTYHLEFWLN